MLKSRREFIKISTASGLLSLVPSYPLWSETVPLVKPAPYMPKPEFVKTNGISMAVYEQGQGIPVVFCHGFPELAFSWRNQIKALSDSGFRAIAPDQRGYGLTRGPADNSQYDIQFLCDDLIGMLDAKGIDKAIFCGHDWGGGIVWSMARLHPDRCLGIIGLNTPASRPSNLPPAERGEKSPITMSPNYYAMTFMQPGRAEAVLEKDVRFSMEFMLSRGGIWNKSIFARLPKNSPERQLDLLTLISNRKMVAEPFLQEDVIQYFSDTFSATGFTGGLNWYRNAIKMGTIMKDAALTIDVPSLYIGAENDVILPPSSADGMEDFIADLEKYTVKDCGHWTQQEKPEEVNRIIIDWLQRKFA